MSSKTSFFNLTIAKKGLKRTMPLWLVHAVIWLFVMVLIPANMSEYYETRPAEMGYYILSTVFIGGTLMAFFFSGAVTEVLSNYLYSSSSIGFHHALPLKRETLFVTNYLVTLTVLLAPAALIAGITALVVKASVGSYILSWLWIYVRMVVFFTGFSLLCAHVTGHVGIGSVIYFLLNFTAVVVELCVKYIMSHFLYGFIVGNRFVTLPLSPIVNIYNSCAVIHDYEPELVYFQGGGYLTALFVVGLLFTAGAYLFYRARRSEDSREIISAHTMRPVFKYTVTGGTALVLGTIFYFFTYEIRDIRPSILVFALCSAVGGAIGYIVAEMFLRRSMKVLKHSWKGMLAAIGVILLFNASIGVDIFNVVGRVPDTDDIASVTVECNDLYRYDAVVKPEDGLLEQVTALHEYIIDNKAYNEQKYYSSEDHVIYSFERISFTYTLNNDSEIERSYYVPLYTFEDGLYDSDTLPDEEYTSRMAFFAEPQIVFRAYEPLFDEEAYQLSDANCEFYGMGFEGGADYSPAVLSSLRRELQQGLSDGTVRENWYYGHRDSEELTMTLNVTFVNQLRRQNQFYYNFTVANDSSLAQLLTDGGNVIGFYGNIPVEGLEDAVDYYSDDQPGSDDYIPKDSPVPAAVTDPA